MSLLVLSAGCSGISIGETSAEAVPRCFDQVEEPVTDPSVVPHDFERSPDELLSPLLGPWQGSLSLENAVSVPLAMEISVDEGSIRAVYVPTDTTCEPWLVADVTLDIDAGETLRGTAPGELFTRNEAQIRADWIDFATFESNLEVPDFGGEIQKGPSVLLDFLFEGDGTWRGAWQFAAHVTTEECDEQTEMCTGGPGAFSPEYRDIGDVVLERAQAP